MNPRQWGLGDRQRISTRDFPPEVLALVDERQGGRYCIQCRELGLETPVGEPLQIDHKQPLSRGGDNNHVNLRWACRSHNCGRGARKIGEVKRPKWARRRVREQQDKGAAHGQNSAPPAAEGFGDHPFGHWPTRGNM